MGESGLTVATSLGLLQQLSLPLDVLHKLLSRKTVQLMEVYSRVPGRGRGGGGEGEGRGGEGGQSIYYCALCHAGTDWLVNIVSSSNLAISYIPSLPIWQEWRWPGGRWWGQLGSVARQQTWAVRTETTLSSLCCSVDPQPRSPRLSAHLRQCYCL